jgi:voltage-gated potassium channel
VLLKNPQTAGYSIALTTILLVAFASVSILIFESGPDANIRTAEDAIWWSVSTITTVGYGDRFPVSVEGRVIAMVLMISGVGLFGALSGTVASLFIGKEESSSELEEVLWRLQRMEQTLAEQRQPLANLETDSRSHEGGDRVST